MPLQTLNPRQQEAVTTPAPYVRVVAGAGSGKTRVLTERIVYLIEEMGIPASAIVAITFTNKAAREMKRRVEERLHDQPLTSHISTFHSFCVRFLTREIHLLGYPRSFTILDSDDQEKVIKEQLEQLQLPRETYKPSYVISVISQWKNAGVSVAQATASSAGFQGEENIAKVYGKYEEYLKHNSYLDFDDLINKSVEILESFPLVREQWNRRISCLLIDEFQDTNNMQYRLIRALCGPDCSLFVVGDPDQTIYTWRGANVDIMLQLEKDYPGTVDIVLNTNYRSTKTILEGANRLIRCNQKRIPKDLVTVNGQGATILFYRAPDPETEARWVIEQIRKTRSNHPELRYDAFAILYRSSYTSRAFEGELMRQRIPYLIFGGIRFFERKEVKDALAYLRLLLREDDEVAFKRIINEPKRGFGEKSLERLMAYAQQEGRSLLATLRAHREEFRSGALVPFLETYQQVHEHMRSGSVMGAVLLDELLQGVGYYAEMQRLNETERLDNLNELKNYLFNTQKTNPDLSLAELIQEITLLSSQDEIVDGDYVSLMTVHTAKGLEYPYVFVVGLSEGSFPNRRAVEERGGDGMEEERRLAYVAFTRAMQRLFVSYNTGYNFSSQTFGQPSRFLGEMGVELESYFQPGKVSPSGRRTTQNASLSTVSTLLKQGKDWNLGDTLEHTAYGVGVILAIEGEALRIAFHPPYGVKLISRKFSGLKRSGGTQE